MEDEEQEKRERRRRRTATPRGYLYTEDEVTRCSVASWMRPQQASAFSYFSTSFSISYGIFLHQLRSTKVKNRGQELGSDLARHDFTEKVDDRPLYFEISSKYTSTSPTRL